MRVSAIQYDVKHNTDENIKTINRLTENFDGNILVLPELCMSGYLFENRAELIKYSVPIPSNSKELNYLAELSSQKSCAVIAGLSEIDGEYIYNSAVVFDCGKYIGKYRKTHLSDFEKRFFDSPEDISDNIGVFKVQGITVGVQICFDLWFPEISRRQILNSADILCVCANFGGDTTFKIASVRATENLTPLVLSNRVGEEKTDKLDAYFLGKSTVIGKSGEYIATAGEGIEDCILSDIELSSKKANVICSDFIEEIKRHYK